MTRASAREMESEKRLAAIKRRVDQFLANPQIKTFWGEDTEPNYTILRTGSDSCKIIWDDGMMVRVSEIL